MDKDILKFALQNAVKYGGKANPGAIIGKILSEHPELKEKAQQISKNIAKIAREVNSMKPDAQLAKLQDLAPELLEKKVTKKHELPELPDAVEGEVVLRMAPYPSGPLHVGNTKTFILNDEYAKRYKGKLLLVLDDTIGSSEKMIAPEAYDLIPEGVKWLGIDYDPKIVYKSDRMEIYYEHAEKLIKMGKAYVCFCDSEALRKNRAEGKICDCREAGVDKTMHEWKKMHTDYKEGEAALRLKTSMEHPNPAFRDRVLCRICEREHPRVGKKYRVWPMLELSWAVDDVLLGITHVIRGKDLMIESDMEKFIWDIFGWKHRTLIHTALVKIEGVKLSKSKASKEVKSGVYAGWDDPRTWSLQSLNNRGILPGAVRNFVVSFGVNQNEITVPVDTLYSENRKLIDPIAKRYFFVENPIQIKIKDAPQREVKLKLHPDQDMGFREFKTSGSFLIPSSEKLEKGKVYRLMNLMNFKDSKFISFEHDAKLEVKMLHWLPADAGNVEVEVLMPDAERKKGVAEKGVSSLKVGDIVQLERFGFCRLHKKGKALEFWYAHK